MKTKLSSTMLIIGLIIFSTTLFCQNSTAKSETLTQLLNQAKSENKNLFMIFGWEGCGWCRVLDKYHKDKEVNALLGKHFFFIKMDIEKNADGKALDEIYGTGGTPSWTIFDKEGAVLIDSDSGNGNIGFPSSKDELAYYIVAMKKAIPSLSDQDGEFLISKLKEYRIKKSQNLL